MKASTILLCIIISMMIIIAVPDFKIGPKVIVAKEDFSIYTGYSGVLNNDIKEDKESEKVQQRCGGTRKLKSGDGITEYDCPGCPDCEGTIDNTSKKCQCGCGKENCTCGRTTAASCVIEELPKSYMICFTAKWCGPCQHFKKVDIPILEKSDWKFGNELIKGLHVLMVDIDKNPEVYKKIMENLPDDLKKKQKGTIPAFIFMKDSKIQDMTENYLNYNEFAEFFNTNMEKK